MDGTMILRQIPSRSEANALLDQWRAGAIYLTLQEVHWCLFATGDIDG